MSQSFFRHYAELIWEKDILIDEFRETLSRIEEDHYFNTTRGYDAFHKELSIISERYNLAKTAYDDLRLEKKNYSGFIKGKINQIKSNSDLPHKNKTGKRLIPVFLEWMDTYQIQEAKRWASLIISHYQSIGEKDRLRDIRNKYHPSDESTHTFGQKRTYADAEKHQHIINTFQNNSEKLSVTRSYAHVIRDHASGKEDLRYFVNTDTDFILIRNKYEQNCRFSVGYNPYFFDPEKRGLKDFQVPLEILKPEPPNYVRGSIFQSGKPQLILLCSLNREQSWEERGIVLLYERQRSKLGKKYFWKLSNKAMIFSGVENTISFTQIDRDKVLYVNSDEVSLMDLPTLNKVKKIKPNPYEKIENASLSKDKRYLSVFGVMDSGNRKTFFIQIIDFWIGSQIYRYDWFEETQFQFDQMSCWSNGSSIFNALIGKIILSFNASERQIRTTEFKDEDIGDYGNVQIHSNDNSVFIISDQSSIEIPYSGNG